MSVPTGFEFHLGRLTEFLKTCCPIPLEMLIKEPKKERVSGPPAIPIRGGHTFSDGPSAQDRIDDCHSSPPFELLQLVLSALDMELSWGRIGAVNRQDIDGTG
jgi:hypothetical protein